MAGIDPLSLAAMAAAGASFGLGAFGDKGGMRQTAGPDESDVLREQQALRTGRQRSAREGARVAIQAGGGQATRAGMGRSGRMGAVAGNVGADLERALSGVEDEVQGLGARLRSSRRYEYEPSKSERMSAFLGQMSGPLLAAGAVRGGLDTQAEMMKDELAAMRAGNAPPQMPGYADASQSLTAGGAPEGGYDFPELDLSAVPPAPNPAEPMDTPLAQAGRFGGMLPEGMGDLNPDESIEAAAEWDMLSERLRPGRRFAVR